MDITRSGPHTVYTVLEEPKAPWYKQDDHHPWANALEFAIATAGADGKGSHADAASTFTTFFHSGYGLQYSSADEGSPNYYVRVVAQTFDLTGFIGKTSGTDVACEDLAAAVHSMINLMGGASRFVDRRRPNANHGFGYINAAVLVGGRTSNNPFYARAG